MTPAELVDIGVNLTHRRFDGDRDAVIARAVAAGVSRMVVTGTCVASSRAAIALAGTRAGVLFATAGIHPHDARHASAAALGELAELARAPRCGPLGSAGSTLTATSRPGLTRKRRSRLSWNWRPKPDCRSSSTNGPPTSGSSPSCVRGGHGCGPRSSTASPAPIGSWLPISSLACTSASPAGFATSAVAWACAILVARVPAERLMIETDAPFLTPRDLRPQPRGGRNEPAFLTHVLAALALAVGRPPIQVAEETTRTARAFFGLGS